MSDAPSKTSPAEPVRFHQSYVVTTKHGAPSPPGPGSLIPRGRIVRVEIEVVVPADANRTQVEEWVESCLEWGGIDDDNPLYGSGLEPAYAPILSDTGKTTDKLEREEEARLAARAFSDSRRSA